MKNIDIRMNMDNLSEDERKLFMNLVEKANNQTLPFNVTVGNTFKIANIEFIRFPAINGGVRIVAKDFVFKDKFDDNTNNLANSHILKRLQTEILPKIEAAVGADNVLEFETELTSLDGLKNYGTMKSKISLPTFDFYRGNIEIFDKYNPESWWWLATPWSTPTHGYDSAVCYVSSGGTVSNDFCFYCNGVRPFLILKSSLFVS